MREVKGKVAFITGAASGMGLGMTRAFTKAGMKVMMADIDGKRLASAAEELKAAGADVAALPCDITVEEQVFAAADPRTGAAGSVFNLLQSGELNHRCEIEGGVLAEESGQLLRGFFRAKR